jgi:ABC-2 type transport system permease protein
MTDQTMNPNALQAVAESAPAAAPLTLHPTQTFLWSVRRELWEHRSLYIAPLAVSALLVIGTLIAAFTLSHASITLSNGDAAQQGQLLAALNIEQQRQLVEAPFDIAAYALMAAAFLVAFFYSLDALYGERRDRSILFWKSMPVSDTTAVLSKALVPILIIPLVAFAVTILTQAAMSLVVAVGLAAHGIHPVLSIAQLPLIQMSAMLLFHLIVIHGLWYAPIYAWLLLVSSFARRAPFLWAVLPPLGIMLVEFTAFHTTYFATLLKNRFDANGLGNSFDLKHVAVNGMSAMHPAALFTAPGLWLGLIVAALFLGAAIQIRRTRGPL